MTLQPITPPSVEVQVSGTKPEAMPQRPATAAQQDSHSTPPTPEGYFTVL
jgi:hypothetical protein